MYARWFCFLFWGTCVWRASLCEETCEYIDKCTCEMSDGTGQVNLHSLAPLDTNEETLTVVDSGWTYRYNPCFGFEPYWYYCFRSDGLALAQTDMSNTYGFDLGTHKSMYYNLTEGNGLSIHYTACDKERQSRVLLICDSGTRDHKFEFIGELIVKEYDFYLTSPCACPGGCDDNGIINPPPTIPPTHEGENGGGDAGGGGVNIPENIEVNVNHNNNDDSKDEDSSAVLWTDVGGAMVALIFHDLLLIIVVAAVVIIAKYTPSCYSNGDSPNGQSAFASGANVIKSVFNMESNA